MRSSSSRIWCVDMAVEQREQRAQAASMVGTGLPWIMTVLWMAGISWLSSQPDTTLPDFWEFAYHDKIQHLGFYIVLGILLCWAFRASGATPGKALLWAVMVGAVFAASDEVHQRFVPTRRCEAADWAADVLGTAIGSAALSLIRRSHVRGRGGADHAIER